MSTLKKPWDMYQPDPNNDPSLASEELLNPANHSLMMIDHEGQMFFAVESHPRQVITNSVGLSCHLATVYDIPTIITTVREDTFSGPEVAEIREFFPDKETYIDRTTMNAWEDTRVVEKVKSFNRPKIVMAGLWTEVCVVYPALSALSMGYEVYVISDACGGVTKEAHDMAMMRMIQAGVKPITSLQYALEVHRDWSRTDKYKEMGDITRRWGGAFGIGIDYKVHMIGPTKHE